jgi:hypothetical protein
MTSNLPRTPWVSGERLAARAIARFSPGCAGREASALPAKTARQAAKTVSRTTGLSTMREP